MDTLPLETLQQICTLACTDGGPTGISLSLTSKCIRAASRTARFHSISLVANPRRIQAFVALYERECDVTVGDRPHIEHLYLSFPDLRQKASQERSSRSLSPPPKWWQRRQATAASLSSRVRYPVHQSEEVDDSAEDVAMVSAVSKHEDITCRRGRTSPPLDPRTSPQYHAAIQRLLHLAAPDAVSLTIEAGFSDRGRLHLPIFDKPLTALRELTLVDVYDPAVLFVDMPDTAPLFPALTHLHILAYYIAYDLCLPRWFSRAPHVTHLAITGINEQYIEELESATGVEIHHTPPLIPTSPSFLPPRTYPSVRVLAMQPYPEPRGAMCAHPLVEHEEMVDDLRQFAERCCAQTDVKAILRAPMDDSGTDRMYTSDAYGDWLERMQGGEGCWVAGVS